MPEYTKIVPKNPNDADETLKAVMDVIIFMTQDADEFVSYKVQSDKVVLTFEAVN
jgi:hypothetical protein